MMKLQIFLLDPDQSAIEGAGSTSSPYPARTRDKFAARNNWPNGDLGQGLPGQNQASFSYPSPSPLPAPPFLPYVRKFLHIVQANLSVSQLLESICTRHAKIYPADEPLSVSRLQDAYQCDLDPDYLVEDVFTDYSSVLAILTKPVSKALNGIVSSDLHEIKERSTKGDSSTRKRKIATGDSQHSDGIKTSSKRAKEIDTQSGSKPREHPPLKNVEGSSPLNNDASAPGSEAKPQPSSQTQSTEKPVETPKRGPSKARTAGTARSAAVTSSENARNEVSSPRSEPASDLQTTKKSHVRANKADSGPSLNPESSIAVQTPTNRKDGEGSEQARPSHDQSSDSRPQTVPDDVTDYHASKPSEEQTTSPEKAPEEAGSASKATARSSSELKAQLDAGREDGRPWTVKQKLALTRRIARVERQEARAQEVDAKRKAREERRKRILEASSKGNNQEQENTQTDKDSKSPANEFQKVLEARRALNKNKPTADLSSDSVDPKASDTRDEFLGDKASPISKSPTVTNSGRKTLKATKINKAKPVKEKTRRLSVTVDAKAIDPTLSGLSQTEKKSPKAKKESASAKVDTATPQAVTPKADSRSTDPKKPSTSSHKKSANTSKGDTPRSGPGDAQRSGVTGLNLLSSLVGTEFAEMRPHRSKEATSAEIHSDHSSPDDNESESSSPASSSESDDDSLPASKRAGSPSGRKPSSAFIELLNGAGSFFKNKPSPRH